MVCDSGFRVQVTGFGLHDLGFRVSGFGFRALGFGFRVSDSGCIQRVELISKHLQSINLVQGNLLHRTVFINIIEVNV